MKKLGLIIACALGYAGAYADNHVGIYFKNDVKPESCKGAETSPSLCNFNYELKVYNESGKEESSIHLGTPGERNSWDAYNPYSHLYEVNGPVAYTARNGKADRIIFNMQYFDPLKKTVVEDGLASKPFGKDHYCNIKVTPIQGVVYTLTSKGSGYEAMPILIADTGDGSPCRFALTGWGYYHLSNDTSDESLDGEVNGEEYFKAHPEELVRLNQIYYEATGSLPERLKNNSIK